MPNVPLQTSKLLCFFVCHTRISAGAHHEDLRFDADPPKAPVSAAKAQALASMKRWTARWTRSERAERIRSTEALFA